ncbi:ankyrin repeat protein [Plectosphaerella cucumerina]|uniref:Ankyrin repeat protein n=1 Tax=Plectosphaerella cucumerina TaxID=40658 RepID=A0A8K0TS06_9PEZI|nr:ankyrin repeat protein [Plectosphaerella cucumerina]
MQMAEPLGIIGVIGVAGQIIQAAVKLGLDWKDAPADAVLFIAEIQTLKTVLSETHTNILLNDDFNNAFHGRHSTLLTLLGDGAGPTDTSLMVSTCKQELETLLDDLKKRAEGRRAGWERLKGGFLAKKTREAVENLQRQCATLNKLVAVDAMTLAVHTHKEVTQARKEQRDWQADRESQAILDWITTADYSAQQSDFLRRRQPGTGQWLLDSAEYQQWIDSTQKTLFCPGIPGAGKTILTSIVVEDLGSRYHDDRGVGIAFLYCNFRRQDEQKVEHLLSSLLRQLSQDQTSLPDCVKALYDQYKGKTRPSLDQLCRVLQSVAKLFSRVFIVVDAIDECQLSDGNRSTFLAELFALQSTSGANVFATSRLIQNITDRFKDSISLEIRAHPEDVRRYVKDNISKLPSCVERNPGLQAEIVSKIERAADGMFLLAQLHFDSLMEETTAKNMRKALEMLHSGPKAYDDAYDDAMKRIERQRKGHQRLAQKVMSWITCTKRPLSTTELQHALAVELGETELDLENIPDLEDMVSVCAGLVTVDEESSIIRLVHYTTQEYFTRTWMRWFPTAQAGIAEACATYLSFDAYAGGACLTDAEFKGRLRTHLLYDYASRFWGDHAREAGETSQVVLDFLCSDMHVEAQVQGLMTNKWRWLGLYSQNFPRLMRGVHVAAYFGLDGAAKILLDDNKDSDTQDTDGRTPLSWAAANGHEAIVKMLLDTNEVDVDSKDKNGQTPLSRAAENKHETVVKMLLDTNEVDVDSKDKYGWTPLSWAAKNGHETVVKMLLDTNEVDVDSKDKNGRTPLSRAAENKHETVVKMLLDTRSVDIMIKDASDLTIISL